MASSEMIILIVYSESQSSRTNLKIHFQNVSPCLPVHPFIPSIPFVTIKVTAHDQNRSLIDYGGRRVSRVPLGVRSEADGQKLGQVVLGADPGHGHH